MYNEWPESQKLKFKYSIVKAVGNKDMTEVIVQEWRKLFKLQKKVVMESLDKDWDLLMTHVYLTDVAGHLYFNNTPKLINIYIEMDKFAREIKDKIGDDVLMIIASDHGMIRGKHNPRAFYSFNKTLEEKPKRITDFYKIVANALNASLETTTSS